MQDLWWLSTRRYFIKWPGRAKRWWNIIEKGIFLPEKFQFDVRSEFYIDGMVPKRHENLGDLDSTDGDTDDDRDTCLDDRAEAESRRLDAMTLDAINCSDPFKMAHVGPGSNPGPRKYLGVVKPAILLRKYHHCSSTML